MKKIIFSLLICILGVIFGFGLIKLIDNRISYHEKLECYQWKTEAEEFAEVGYYLTEWQKKQCKAKGIEIILIEPIIRK